MKFSIALICIVSSVMTAPLPKNGADDGLPFLPGFDNSTMSGVDNSTIPGVDNSTIPGVNNSTISGVYNSTSISIDIPKFDNSTDAQTVEKFMEFVHKAVDDVKEVVLHSLKH